jgi:hypothetical protein
MRPLRGFSSSFDVQSVKAGLDGQLVPLKKER